MQSIPNEIIEEINSILGTKGFPYSIYTGNDPIQTNCYKWNLRKNIPEIYQSLSPQLQKALADSQSAHFQIFRGFTKSRESNRRFISRKYPQLLPEYDDFIDELNAYEKQISNPIQIESPPTPKEVEEANQRIAEKLKPEFSGNGIFDIDRYAQRVQELWQEEPLQTQQTFEAIKPELEAFAEALQSAEHQKYARLKQVRAHLQGKQYFAYGDVIVAPTEDQFKILEIEMTSGNNFEISTEKLITELKKIDSKYGIDLLAAGFDFVIFRLVNVPAGEEAEALGKHLVDICPDLYDPPDDLSAEIELWWD